MVDVPPVDEHALPVAFSKAVLQSVTAAVVPLHAPQEVSVPTVASQPFPTVASQAANPVSQPVIEHVLAAQLPVATFGSAAQSLPQLPQLGALVRRSVSQPLPELLSQLP